MKVALDFDGTCCTHVYPNIGEDIGAIPVLKELCKNGHTLILWTMRSGKEYDAAVEWLKDRGVKVHSCDYFLNLQKTWTQSAKLYAQAHIDDAAIGTPLTNKLNAVRPYVDWVVMRKHLVAQGLLPN